ncbi:hypothetical protein Tco_0937322 [Tanacetum coccineum]|uniref:Uncharacterized protein n=1 Tax=Tanacetum coccineum TaxID=301880 RepID=A0ABQ5DGJ5_9ASTR
MKKGTKSQTLDMTKNLNMPSQILNAQAKATKKENVENKNLHVINKELKTRPDDTLYEPRKETASRRNWFKKPTPPQEPIDPDWHVGKTMQEGPPQKWFMTLTASTPTDKSLKDFDELMSTPIDFSSYILNGLEIENLTQEILLGLAFRLLKGTRSNYVELEYVFEECYNALSEKLDRENPKGDDYPFDLSKPLPLITRGKHQRVPFEYFINNDLKYLQGGVSTMTYTTSTTKTKAAQYDLPGIEDNVSNIWSPVKVAYDKYTLWGISHWREQRKSFYAYARGIQSRGDVYSTKRILAVTHVKVMRKHGYGYLEDIVVRRADNVLYRFKEGNFPRILINDIEDMLILVVQNRLTNLSGDDVADFAIALRMFTRSLVIQKRVEDLQLGASFFARRHNQEYRHRVLPGEKMEQFGKEKSSFHDQGHQQAAKGKEDDEKFGEIRWFNTKAGNLVKNILLKLNLSDHRSILTDSKKTCNNDKNLSGVQLEHEKEDELVAVVVKVVHECRHWMGDYIKTLEGSGGESFWEEGDDFRVDVLRFHTCLTDILGFLEKLEWWFEQDIDDEGEEDEEEKDAKDGLAKYGNASLRV